MCYCFLQGLFTAWGMKQGLIVSHGNIPKLCLCRFVSDQSSDSFSSNSELFDEVEFLSEEMCENGTPELSMDEEGLVSC